MKQSILFGLIVGLCALPVFAQETQQPPQISMTGSAEVKVAPDIVNIRVGVETRDASLDTARQQHDERMKNALKFLKSSGIPNKDIQTDFISITPEYGSGSSWSSSKTIYIVRKSIEINLTNVTNLETVLTGLLNNGVNMIHNVDFRTTQLRKYRDQARVLAIKAAKEKADALCAELGVKRGKPLNVSTSEWGGPWSFYGSYWGGQGYNSLANNSQVAVQNPSGASDSPGDTLSLGQISISATVNVSFAIE